MSIVAALACLATRSPGAEDPPDAGAPAAADVEELRSALEQSLNNATLVGNFTVTGQEKSELAAERYELSTVRHLGQDRWLIKVRIRYGEHDVAIPLTLPIRWAGDTPIITVDNLSVPGLGVYTARVMIYRDHYAGFWTGADHGGHLFGVIERDQEDDSSVP